MFDNNWKTWVVLVIAFVGASFELLKHLPTAQNVSWEKENLHYGVDGKPYSVRQLPKKLRVAHQDLAIRVAGDTKVLAEALKTYTAATAATATEAAHKDAPAKAAAKKKKNEDDYEEVIDPVTGKKVRRKKKKEAKKEEEKSKAASTTPAAPAIEKDELTDPNTIAAAIAAIANTGDLPLPIKKSANDPFASLQEWERLLLARPDLAETKVFIQNFKNHTVSSDIYYKITKLMLADSRPEMKSLGVLCAGSNPSVLSFQILAGAEATGSADVKTNAQKFLDSYSNSLANLAILQGVLRAGDNSASTFALKQLDVAASRFLTATTPTPAPGTQNNHNANAAQFQPFVTILLQLASSTDASLATQANHSLTALRALLDGSNSSIAATP